MTHTAEEIIAKLGELDSDEIARLLRDEGITGTPGSAMICPVARYVQRTTEDSLVAIGMGAWSVVDTASLRSTAAGELPPSVREFVDRFDDDEYRELRATS